MPQSHRPGTQSATTSYEVENKWSDELWKVHVTQAKWPLGNHLLPGKMYISQVVAKNLIVITLFTCILVVVWMESMELHLQAVVYWESLEQLHLFKRIGRSFYFEGELWITLFEVLIPLG